jgi:hypothetical protein
MMDWGACAARVLVQLAQSLLAVASVRGGLAETLFLTTRLRSPR